MWGMYTGSMLLSGSSGGGAAHSGGAETRVLPTIALRYASAGAVRAMQQRRPRARGPAGGLQLRASCYTTDSPTVVASVPRPRAGARARRHAATRAPAVHARSAQVSKIPY